MKLIIHDFPPRLFKFPIINNIRPHPTADVICESIGK
jgi:hypothetical protein